ncbi:hypothetical protein [Ruixingdingia sedimenti]|uniref:DUF1269 domain-containing protein n=1 Tax=Ruixingdingia sedimenti TaxID=3073604 RepID=A0ABU1FAU9_9RHOB|nr:hypothetical protein [Xinfangfangia sp. LG-4]MDR5653537.1 hypothetical protein [Xinfangfangia sp. LG-4]
MPVTTRLYDTYDAAADAVDRIEALGLDGVDASILGGDSLRDGRVSIDPVTGTPVYPPEGEPGGATAAGATVGAALGGGAGLLAGLGLIAVPGIGPLVATGWLITALTGAAGGALAGATVGAIADVGIAEEDAALYGEAFRRGGVAVSVRFPDAFRAAVEDTLATTPARPPADLRRAYEAEGWRG